MQKQEPRVVITGLGLVTPLGTGVEKTWKALLSGQSGISRIDRFDPESYPVQIAAQVTDFRAEDWMEKKKIKQMDLFSQYAVASSKMALADSGYKVSESNAQDLGVLIGAGLGGLHDIEQTHQTLLDKGPRRVSPFFIPKIIANLASGQVSIEVGAKGPNLCVVTACTTGTHALGEAYHIIRRGDATAMLAGGTESTITPLCVAGFAAMRALSTRNDEPKKASRPFDADRNGFVIGEGCGVVMMETLESAQARGAKIYAELTGYGLSADAYHLSAPPEDGSGAISCMSKALDRAGLSPENIDYINAHGTSTELNDKTETMAIKKVFGDHAYKLSISSTKSMTGHLLGAAGGVESVFSVLALTENIIPPTINYETPDPDCDLNYTPNQAQSKELRHVLSNSFGFGGTNGSLIFSKMDAIS
ncbi:MAG: beta-ketoacyl-ACP synthase II [Bdellovibrionales bacterium]|nr:beta-ketoacyl-ACP synthase II [Bdellovibrionales bacterium]